MNERVRTSSLKRNLYAKVNPGRVPVRRSAANYYFLTLFCSIAIFFFVWALLHDGLDDTPWIAAALSAVGTAVSMTFFREIVLRRKRDREQAARRLSHHLQEANLRRPEREFVEKLSLRRNDQMLVEIRTKSEAAKVLGQLAEAHQEVFELCDSYLGLAFAELAAARPGSPRVPALRKGTIAVANRHRFHMLKWAELRSRTFTNLANHPVDLSEKIQAAEDALDAVDKASSAYPDEPALADSLRVLQAFLTSARVRSSIALAESADAKGSYAESIGHYQDALTDLHRFNVVFEERATISGRIKSEIQRLGRITGKPE